MAMLTSLFLFAALSTANIQLDKNANGANIIRIKDGASGNVSIYVGNRADASLPALLGTTTKDGNDLIFTPRFPLQPGGQYRIEFSGTDKINGSLVVPSPLQSSASFVQHVYPSGDTMPANLLRLYVQFSAPMSRGEAYRHIRLLNENGREVESAFLELGEELWDARQTRFTLLFDPGRIKRDLVPNIDDGSPLKPGKRYTLIIDSGWAAGDGQPMRSGWKKSFSVIEADRSSPDPKAWSLVTPSSLTRQALVINFPEALDYGLLQRTLRVVGSEGNEIAGSIAIENAETRWHFTPTQPWKAGEYRLLIDRSLEDLAGNRIGRLFEVDTRTAPDMANRPSGESTSLSFLIPAQTEK